MQNPKSRTRNFGPKFAALVATLTIATSGAVAFADPAAAETTGPQSRFTVITRRSFSCNNGVGVLAVNHSAMNAGNALETQISGNRGTNNRMLRGPVNAGSFSHMSNNTHGEMTIARHGVVVVNNWSIHCGA